MSDSTDSLYTRLGGADAMEQLISDFYTRVLEDTTLAPFFKDTALERLRAMQREFLSMALGGPVTYTGRPLGHVHHGRGITKAHFGAFVCHLTDTLAAHGVATADIDHVIETVNTFANEVTGTSY
jgi:hemoglobin